MIEPDEDEDDTRLCAHCGVRPRWSKHGTCKRCAVCTGGKLRAYILHRKNETPPKKVVQSAQVKARMARYHTLRGLGMNSADARHWCTSAAKFGPVHRFLTKT